MKCSRTEETGVAMELKKIVIINTKKGAIITITIIQDATDIIIMVATDISMERHVVIIKNRRSMMNAATMIITSQRDETFWFSCL